MNMNININPDERVNPNKNVSAFKKSPHTLWITLTVVIVLLDRITKIIALGSLPLQEPITVLPFFNLFLTYNAGAAFSFLNKAGGWQGWLFGIIALSISLYIVLRLTSSTIKDAVERKVALALVLGGALGNFYDRLAYRVVVDFLDFHVNNWHWPAFNIADSAICIGVMLLILTYDYDGKGAKKNCDYSATG